MYKAPVSPFHKEVENFKRELIRTTLEAYRGNHPHAALSLSLKRTYLPVG